MAELKKCPEVRFDGFTEDWETSEVGHYYDFKNGLNKGKEYFGYGKPIINFTDVFHKRGLFVNQLNGKVDVTADEIKNYSVKKGDLFFTRTSETIEDIGYTSVMLDEPEDAVFSGFVLRARPINDDPLNNLFKKFVFNTISFRNEMVKKSSMTTRALTSGTAIKKMYFTFPVNKEEQKQIGLYITQLEKLLEYHQTQLEKLKNLKKAMLVKMFPQEGATVPEIRFNGFDGDWEVQPLTKIVDLGSSKRVHREDYVAFGIPFFRGTEISKLGSFSIIEDLLYISKEHYEKLKNNYGIPKIGDILITAVGTIGNAFLINSDEKFYFKDGNLIWLKNIKINSEYLITFLKNGIGRKRVLESAIGSNQKALTMDKLGNINIDVPSIQEQEKIGNYFRNLEVLIENHQKQLDKLINIKKACLSKMFVA